MSALTHLLPYMGSPALVVALGSLPWRLSRARLLRRAGDTALEKGRKDPQGKAALQVIEALTGDEPWFKQILGRKSDSS